MKTSEKILIYQTSSGALSVTLDPKAETIWLSLNEISDFFDADKSGISRHLKNIFSTGELDRYWVVAKNATTGSDKKSEK